MADAKRWRLVGAIVVLIGALLLIVSAFMPWYMEQFSSNGATITSNAYPGIPSSNGTIQFSCSGLPSGANCLSQSSYKDSHLNNTGNIAEAGYFLAIVGFVLGLVGAILGLMSRNNPRRAGPAMALATVAWIIAIAAVGLFAAALPGAIGNDTPGHSGSGPWSSFAGSSTTSGVFGVPLSGTFTWGPAVGWYLAIAAFVLMLVGAILIMRFRRDAEPAPATAPAPMAGTPAPAGAPPAAPPS
jgi:uncharacterized membrane protein